MPCSYKVPGQDQPLSLPQFKAWLADGGLDMLYPDGDYPGASVAKTSTQKNSEQPKLSQSQPTTGSTIEQVKSWLPKRVKPMLDAGKLEIVQSVDDLPEQLRPIGAALKMVAWHGSPHNFDQFSLDKIGTGEGAQAFGYGLYFTDAKDIAEWYRNALTRTAPVHIKINGRQTTNSVIKYNAEQLFSETGDVTLESLSKYLSNKIANLEKSGGRIDLAIVNKELKPALKILQNSKSFDIKLPENKGRLYKVELAPEADEYLDWDKPLSEQSEKIRDALEKWAESDERDWGNTNGFVNKTMTGKQLYKSAASFREAKDISDAMHKAGIRGIRYKAEGGKSDAYNYVIFDDADVSITAKYAKLAGIQGLYDNKTDTTYLVADMLNKGNVNAVLAHELLHRGLVTDAKLKTATDRFQADMQRRFDLASKGMGPKIEQDAVKRVLNANTPKADQIEEFMAYMVSEYAKNPESLSERFKKSLQDFIAAIRAFLVRNGLDFGFVKSLTPADLMALSGYGAKVASQKVANNKVVSPKVVSGKLDTVKASTKTLPEKINIDGVERWTVNSNGKPIAQDEESIRNFWNWFGDSKVVDDQSRPLVVYHGTAGDVIFFDKLMLGISNDNSAKEAFYFTNSKIVASGYALELNRDQISYFKLINASKSNVLSQELSNLLKKEADKLVENSIKHFNEFKAYGGNVLPVYLRIQNPLLNNEFNGADSNDKKFLSLIKKAKTNKNDGVIIYNVNDSASDNYNELSDIYAAFEPTQIKSAIGNTGEFNPENRDIRYSIEWIDKVAPDLSLKIADHLSTKKTFNFWNNTIGTQPHKAAKDKDYARVFKKSLQFEQDVARFANEDADLAPTLLPKTGENPLKIASEIREGYRRNKSAKKVGEAIFDSTILDRRLTDQELSKLTDKERTMYNEFFAAVNASLDNLAKSEMFRVGRSLKLESAPRELSLEQTADWYTKQIQEPDKDYIKDLQNRIKDYEALLNGKKPRYSASANEINEDSPQRINQILQGLKDERDDLLKQQEMAQENADVFNEKRDAIQKLKKQAYAPLMRFGQYTVNVMDGDSHEFFGMFETEAEANKMARLMREEYPDANITQGVMSQEDWKMFRGVTPETMNVFARMMGVEQDEAFQAFLKTAVNNQSALKRLIKRKKIEGFDMDAPRVLATFLTSNARMASKNYHLGEMVDAIAQIPKEKGDVRDEAVNLYEFVQNPQIKGAWARNVLFAWYLGGSAASAMVNLSQTMTTTMPYLHQFGSDAKSLGLAMKLAARPNSITGKLKDALKRAEEEGVTAPHQLHMLYGESMRGGLLALERLSPISKAWGALFSAAEAYNRRVAFIAAYQLATKGGKQFEDALKRIERETGTQQSRDPFEFAADAVDQTQFIYTKSSRPNWARSTVGSTLFTFKQFSINYLEFLSRLPPKERAIALGVLVLAAGASGLPGADDADDVIDTIGQSLGYNTNVKDWKERVATKMLGDTFGDFALHGISAFTPFDISGRLSVGNVIPGTAILKKSENDKSRDVLEFAGAAGSLAAKVVEAFDAAESREGAAQFLKSMTGALVPKAIQDAYKAGEMLQTGQYKDYKGRKITDVTASDALWKALGLQPSRVADKRLAERLLNQDITLTKEVETDIADLWAQGRYENDDDKIAEAKSLLKKWNARNPDTPIKIDLAQIARRLKQMRMSSRDRLLKTAPKEMRGYVNRRLENNDESLSDS